MAIQELSEQLSNQIAAGEVIERPSSVVKELVENALDAHSHRIEIFVEEAGTKKITIIDDGDGIPADEVVLAFRRHATSKINSVRDLFHIKTLGFRGEALPSIASVSRVHLQTAIPHADKGYEVTIEGSHIVSQGVAPARPGTKIEVTDLFYNTPARLKYMKSLKTELSAITQVVQTLALSHPDVQFRLVRDGKEAFRTLGTGDIKQVLGNIYQKKMMQQLFTFENQSDDFKIYGAFSLPELTRSNNHNMTIILNGRAIRNYQLRRAIIEGYGTKLMTGFYPVGVLYIEMDPVLVDVNVHPTKQEVRLSKEESLSQLITASIQQALSEERLVPKVSPLKSNESATQTQLPLTSYNSAREGVATTLLSPEQLGRETPSYQEQLTVSTPDTPVEETWVLHEAEMSNDAPIDAPLSVDNDHVEKEKGFPELEYFGQMHGTYLFAQNEQGLFIIDQHAAQERIKYEHYRVTIGQVEGKYQLLAMPLVFTFSPSESQKLEEKLDLLAQLGVELEPFGRNTYTMRSHPIWMTDDPEKVTQELIDRVLNDEKLTIESFREDTAIMMSCKGSIKANHYLSDAEARQLIEDLSHCQNPYNCPHGRPVMIEMTNYELERLFKRIQDPH